jgi:hypothetical protein
VAFSAIGFMTMGSGVAAPACKTAPPKAMLERFISAACESCWQNTAAPDRPGELLVLDWIAPAGDGGAPLASAALTEASVRANNLPVNETVLRRVPLGRPGAPRVRIADGPGWNGYVGLSLTVQRIKPLPAGAVAYMALVERVPAGSEGSPVARQLVRAVVGPLPLDELATHAKVQHFRATRLPEAARADRLGSVGWVETAQGTVIAAAQSPLPGCTKAK